MAWCFFNTWKMGHCDQWHYTFILLSPSLVEKLKCYVKLLNSILRSFWSVTLLLVFHVYKATTKWEEVFIVQMELELSNWSLQSKLSLIDSHASNVHWYSGGTLSFSITLSSLIFLITAASHGFNTGGVHGMARNSLKLLYDSF